MQHCWIMLQHGEQVWPNARNIVQRGGQTHATCCVQQCCTNMLHPFGQGLMCRFDACTCSQYMMASFTRTHELTCRQNEYVQLPSDSVIILASHLQCGDAPRESVSNLPSPSIRTSTSSRPAAENLHSVKANEHLRKSTFHMEVPMVLAGLTD